MLSSFPQLPSASIGIYQIRNLVTGDLYIGSSSQSIRRRFNRHKAMLIGGTHHSIIFQNAWNKYGEKSFVFEVLEICSKKEDCIPREQHWLDLQFPKYNVCRSAVGPLGHKASKETREKMSKANMGHKRNLGKPWSDERKHARRSAYYKQPVTAVSQNEEFHFSSFFAAEGNGFKRYEIRRTILGRRATYHGFIWKIGELT